MASQRTPLPAIEVVVRLHTLASGEVCASLELADHFLTLSVEDALLLLRVWNEGPDVIRGSLNHAQSGSVAMFQGNDALRRLAEAIHLRIDKSEDEP